MEPEISTELCNRNPLKMRDGLRQCYRCKEYKELTEFYTTKNHGKVYYRPDCKICTGENFKAWSEKNFSKLQLSKKKSALKSTYGITYEDYQAKLAEQDGCCSICGIHYTEVISKRYTSFAVDHDRRCCGAGKACAECVRGLLCIRCNRALGMFGDDTDILESAIKYLTAYKAKH